MKSASDSRIAEVDLYVEFPTYVANNKATTPPNVADEGRQGSSLDPARPGSTIAPIDSKGTWSADRL